MKKWLVPVATLLVVAVVAVLLAMRPSQSSEPTFTEYEVLRLTDTMVAGMPLPPGANWTKCVEARYHAGNGLWVVTCNFYVYADQEAKTPLLTRTYSISDQTGKLQR